MRLEPTDMTYVPRGFRWPWYPIYMSRVQPTNTINNGDYLSISYETVGDTTDRAAPVGESLVVTMGKLRLVPDQITLYLRVRVWLLTGVWC